MSKNFWIILAVVIIGLFGIFKLTGSSGSTSKSDKYANGNIFEVKESDHKVGAGNKKVTVIEYGDFECPACGGFYPIMEQAREEYKDDITFVFRHFPLISSHKNAQAAARAAEAAASQGKFFEMYNQLYSTQQDWSSISNVQTTFDGFAQQLGLDMAKYKLDFASEEINNRIAADFESGKKIGVSGTPAIYINGKAISNPGSYTVFKQALDAAIAEANPGSTQPTPANTVQPETAPAQ